jgi:predicted acetyltransferase
VTEPTIREIHGDEMLEVFFWLMNYAFHSTPPMSGEAEWRESIKGRKRVRYVALFEEGRAAATVAGSPLTQQVRGALFGMGGIWGVATHPAKRRRGYSRQVLARMLSLFREDGRPLSCLYPFRESFYERLGYATFPLPRIAKLAPSGLMPLLEADLGGDVELLSIRDGYDVYREYLRTLQQRTHGMAVFDTGDRVRAERRNAFWLALAKVKGELAGLILYDLRGEDVTQFTLRAIRFYYDTSQAKYLLLQWIARHVDQANKVEIWLPPFELPETWLADMQVRIESAVRAPMGRVVDVAQIGGMQTGLGRFAARIRDPLCAWNEGVWQFETVDGLLRVNPGVAADCDLSIQALAALIYGTHDPVDFRLKDWGNPSAEVEDTMRAMFPPAMPYLHESY